MRREVALRREVVDPAAADVVLEEVDRHDERYEAGATVGGARACRLRQTARFLLRGLAGLIYRAMVLPFHGFVFRVMLRGIKRSAEATPEETAGRSEIAPAGASRSTRP